MNVYIPPPSIQYLFLSENQGPPGHLSRHWNSCWWHAREHLLDPLAHVPEGERGGGRKGGGSVVGREEGVWEGGGGSVRSKLKQVSQLCHDTDLTTHMRVLPHRNEPSVHLYRRPLLNMHQNLVQRLITVALQHKRKQSWGVTCTHWWSDIPS